MVASLGSNPSKAMDVDGTGVTTTVLLAVVSKPVVGKGASDSDVSAEPEHPTRAQSAATFVTILLFIRLIRSPRFSIPQ